MQKFWKMFSAVIKEIMADPYNISPDLVNELKACYWEMQEEERESCLKEILTFTDNDVPLYIYLLSFLLQTCKDEKIVDVIEEILLSEKLTFLDNLNITSQLNMYVFANQIDMDETKYYKTQCQLHEKHVREVAQELNLSIDYIPYEKRNKKRIILMISPLLGEGHAPTKRLVNHYRYFEKLGYEVYVYATNHQWIQTKRAANWWDLRYYNSICDASIEFTCAYYGYEIHGYHISYRDETYLSDTKNALERIAEYNPAFVMAIGDGNILADLCNQFTTVVTMGCVNNAPVTIAPIIARYFDCTEEKKQEYLERLKPEQKIIDVQTIDELGNEEQAGIKRENFGLREDDFVIIIAGNRLDTEVGDSTKQILNQILRENDNAVVVFIGECPMLKKELQNAERYKFLGMMDNFKGAVGLGDVFLNPPRAGGGTGGLYAIEEEVPVITLGGCDVANVGEMFVCKTLEDMPKLVWRYRTDVEFMKKQKSYCRQRASEFRGIDNVSNVKKMCDQISVYVQNLEKNKNSKDCEKIC